MPKDSKVRAVIIEDQTLFRVLLKGFLAQERGYEVIGQAEDGPSGLQLCRDTKPDLVILDVFIPGITGDKLAEKIRKELPEARILVMSGSSDPELIEHLKAVGVHGFVHKEQNPEELLAAIDAVAKGESYFFHPTNESLSIIRTVIIEDETLVRLLLGGMLKSDPRFHLEGEAQDGESGIALCLEKKPDLVLLDVLIPKKSGPEVATRLLKELPDTRILVVSARQEPAIIRGILQTGVHGFVDKRQRPTFLKDAILEVARGRTFYSDTAQDILKEMSSNLELRLTPSVLSPREIEILTHVAKGLRTKEITTELNISEATVKTHRYNIMRKLDVHDIAGLTRYAFDQGLLVQDDA
jgi:DNA-binding NarL/FixJ family response regulator